MRLSKWFPALVALCCLFAAGWAAVEGGLAVEVAFATHQELAAKMFLRLDKNQDGILSGKELAAQKDVVREMLHGIPISTFQILADEDCDQMIESDEYRAWFADRMVANHRLKEDWVKGDSDKNGELTLEEYLSSRMGKYALSAPTGCPAGFNPGPADTMCTSRPRSGVETATTKFQRMDRNDDGAISEEELLLYFSPDDFASADRNGDGMVDKQEYLTAPQNWRGDSDRSNEEIETEFKRIDNNYDDKITRREFEEDLRAQRLQSRYQLLDQFESHGDTPESPESQDHWISFNDPIALAPNALLNNVNAPSAATSEEMRTIEEHLQEKEAGKIHEKIIEDDGADGDSVLQFVD